jgi:hypothetical protein
MVLTTENCSRIIGNIIRVQFCGIKIRLWYFIITQSDASAKSLHLQVVDIARENKSLKSGSLGD